MLSKRMKICICSALTVMLVSLSYVGLVKHRNKSIIVKATKPLTATKPNYTLDNELDRESDKPVTDIDPSLSSLASNGSSDMNIDVKSESRISKTGDIITDPAFSSKEEKQDYEEVYEQKDIDGQAVMAPKFIKDKKKQEQDLGLLMATTRCGQFYTNQVVHIDFKLDDTNTDVPINANVNNPNGDNVQNRIEQQKRLEGLDNTPTSSSSNTSTSSGGISKPFSTQDGKGSTVRYSGQNGDYALTGNRSSDSFKRITKSVGLNTYSDWYVDPEIFNSSDSEVMARLINSEAGDEPYEGKLAVGSVILNRVRESGYTMRDIIFQRKQFFGTQTKWFKSKPNNESYKAAQEVLNGVNVIPTSMKFADLRICNPRWAHEYKFIRRIGNHWFFE